jgi:hypothetical protein
MGLNCNEFLDWLVIDPEAAAAHARSVVIVARGRWARTGELLGLSCDALVQVVHRLGLRPLMAEARRQERMRRLLDPAA